MLYKHYNPLRQISDLCWRQNKKNLSDPNLHGHTQQSQYVSIHTKHSSNTRRKRKSLQRLDVLFQMVFF